MTRDEIATAVGRVYEEGDAFWQAFDVDAFFRQKDGKWSPAQTVRHLTKSTRPVAKALRMPRLLLRILFGPSNRKSTSFDELASRYEERLSGGFQAGGFAPSAETQPDLPAWRARIMSDRQRVKEDLVNIVRRWPEDALDRYLLPHPALGKLTVREMLYFTIHHHKHHEDVIRRRTAST